jgi:hypothetical protein
MPVTEMSAPQSGYTFNDAMPFRDRTWTVMVGACSSPRSHPDTLLGAKLVAIKSGINIALSRDAYLGSERGDFYTP